MSEKITISFISTADSPCSLVALRSEQSSLPWPRYVNCCLFQFSLGPNSRSSRSGGQPNRSMFVAIARTLPSHASILRHASMRNRHETMPVAAANGAAARIRANQVALARSARDQKIVSRVTEFTQGACNVNRMPGNVAYEESISNGEDNLRYP